MGSLGVTGNGGSKAASQLQLAAALKRNRSAVALGRGEPDRRSRLGGTAATEVLRCPEIRGQLAPLGYANGRCGPDVDVARVLVGLSEPVDDLDGGDDEDADGSPDSRCMVVKRGLDRRLIWGFRVAVAMLTESEWSDWPLEGPRTLAWLLKFIAQNYGSSTVRLSRFPAERRLTYADVTVSEQFSIMQVLELAIVVDQVQASELACFELAARRAQMAELKHRSRFLPGGSGGGKGGADPYADTHLYMGVAGTRGMLAVLPSLEKFVSADLKEEFEGLRARRRAHEERARVGKGSNKGEE